MNKAAPRARKPAAKRSAGRSAANARQIAALQARVTKLEKQIKALALRDEALDHSIEELAAAWVAES